jgi:DNA end-binding protein Ku
VPRSIWNGAISFGLVTIPVALYSAVERKNELSFRLLHAKDNSRIDYKRFCDEEQVEVAWDEIVKGYEYEKGQYVVVTDEDFEKVRVPATQTFEIRDFVPADAIDSIYFDHPYYVAPSGRTGGKAYALLRDALDQTGRIGIGTVVLRQREHLAALEPAGKVLALTTMRFAYEVRKPGDIDVPAKGEGYSEREMTLARQLMDTLVSDWEPERYRDTYRDALLELIERKAQGKPLKAAPAARRPAVTNLVKALQASLERRPPARAEGRAAARRRAGTRGRRRAA